MNIIQSRHFKRIFLWFANLTAETLVIVIGAAVIAGLWYLGFVLKIF